MGPRRRAVCPDCGYLHVVSAAGVFGRHKRTLDGTPVPKNGGRRQTRSETEPCPGAGKEAGLW